MIKTKHTPQSLLKALHALDNSIIAVAMDLHSGWHGYRSMPVIKSDCWETWEGLPFIAVGDQGGTIIVDYAGNWADSLVTIDQASNPLTECLHSHIESLEGFIDGVSRRHDCSFQLKERCQLFLEKGVS